MQGQSNQTKVTITPRDGIRGWLDHITGPGATRAELVLQFTPAVIAAVLAPLHAASLKVEWSNLQLFLIGFLALDLAGGVLTNATSAAKRWFHRPGQRWVQHFKFVLLHLSHIALVAVVFRDSDLEYFFIVGGYLLIASLLILHSPLYLQRTFGIGLFGLGLVSGSYLLVPTPGLEWFLPLFFLKLLVSHLIFEVPFRRGDRVESMSATRF